MRAAVIGYGGVGRAFIKLIYDKKNYLHKEGLQIQVNYIIGSHGGIYNPEGIDLKNLIQFGAVERDITKYPQDIFR